MFNNKVPVIPAGTVSVAGLVEQVLLVGLNPGTVPVHAAAAPAEKC